VGCTATELSVSRKLSNSVCHTHTHTNSHSCRAAFHQRAPPTCRAVPAQDLMQMPHPESMHRCRPSRSAAHPHSQAAPAMLCHRVVASRKGLVAPTRETSPPPALTTTTTARAPWRSSAEDDGSSVYLSDSLSVCHQALDKHPPPPFTTTRILPFAFRLVSTVSRSCHCGHGKPSTMDERAGPMRTVRFNMEANEVKETHAPEDYSRADPAYFDEDFVSVSLCLSHFFFHITSHSTATSLPPPPSIHPPPFPCHLPMVEARMAKDESNPSEITLRIMSLSRQMRVVCVCVCVFCVRYFVCA
jgi:hypothetical protein